MWRGSKSPTTDVSATSSSRSVGSSSNLAPSGLQRLDPGPGYDEDAALQAALQASAREHAAHTGQSSGPTSFETRAQHPLHDEDRQLQQALERSKQSSDEQLAYELQQQELEQARKSGVSTQPSPSQQADPFAILGGLVNTAPSTHAPQQPQPPQQQQPRPTNNPFAPDRRMPWDIRPQSQAAAGGASASNKDPFASLPPLYAPPSMPPQQPAQPALSPSRPQQPYLPPGIPQPHQHHQQPQQGSSWQAGYPAPWANGLPFNSPSGEQGPQPSNTDDEALARALQQQLDMEEPPRPRSDTRDEALAKALQEQMNREAQPTASSTSYRPNTSGLPAGVPPPQRQGVDPNLCGGCGRPAHCGWGTYVTALGRTWHTGCFVCGHCQQPISGQFVSQPGACVPYHSECYRLKFGQRCCVCADIIPEVPGRGVVYMTHDFWKDQKSCPAHQEDGTLRCTACQRLCPREEQWAQLEEGRHLCHGCLDTIVVDTQDAQPLYTKIMEFFEGMGMKLPVKPPLMLVDSTALNSAEEREAQPTGGAGGRGGRRGGGPVFHTRGLTLTQEYRQIRTIRSVPNRGFNSGLLPFFIRPETTRIEGPTHTEVTAILVQYGLPWLLTGSILAHELMHAWLRLAGLTQLSLDVEEGLCQLMALLWLEHQPPAPEGTWEERLASYFAHQIRTDTSLVYGDGFRAAHEAFQKHGLGATLASVRATGRLPID
ncbi:g2395 [Coccomyxa elongata]